MQSKRKNKIRFYRDYIDTYGSVFSEDKLQKILSIQNVIENKIKKKKFIFVCGNGGSASIANHFLCDFNKGIKYSSNKKILPKIISLSTNIELITATANDYSYEKIFKEQIENYATPNDCLITLSCSGNSKNIINVIKYAKKKRMFIISLTGFNKSPQVKNISNINFNVGVKNYGICEDVFQSIMHIISQGIRKNYSSKKNEIL